MSAPASSIPLAERFLVTPKEFASHFGRHSTWGYRQIEAGKLKAVSKRGRLMISRAEVERFARKSGTRLLSATGSQASAREPVTGPADAEFRCRGLLPAPRDFGEPFAAPPRSRRVE
jgi:hypothetical protein